MRTPSRVSRMTSPVFSSAALVTQTKNGWKNRLVRSDCYGRLAGRSGVTGVGVQEIGFRCRTIQSKHLPPKRRRFRSISCRSTLTGTKPEFPQAGHCCILGDSFSSHLSSLLARCLHPLER
jgi:hypothetical protein